MVSNQRQNNRIPSNLPIHLSVGSQLTFQGYLKDISLISAFVRVQNRVYLEPHEELKFSIKRHSGQEDQSIEGRARISRIADGEGIAIYFTQMDQASTERLRQLVTK